MTGDVRIRLKLVFVLLGVVMVTGATAFLLFDTIIGSQNRRDLQSELEVRLRTARIVLEGPLVRAALADPSAQEAQRLSAALETVRSADLDLASLVLVSPDGDGFRVVAASAPAVDGDNDGVVSPAEDALRPGDRLQYPAATAEMIRRGSTGTVFGPGAPVSGGPTVVAYGPGPEGTVLAVGLFASRAAELVARGRLLIAGAVGAGLLASLLVGGLFGLRLAGRIRRLVGVADRAAAGDFSPVQPLSGGDELADLSESLRVMAQELDRLTAQRQALLAQARSSAEGERRRIARDLHDGPVQQIQALAMRLDYARILAERGVDATAALRDAYARIESSVTDLRRIVYALRPPALEDRGLAGALGQRLAEVAAGGNVHTQLDVPEDLRLDPDVEATVYRFCEEALSNTRRHSGADHVSLTVLADRQVVEVTVVDTGRGFDPGEALARGRGLSSLSERARLSGGELSVEAAPGEGARVRLTVPTKEVSP